MSYHAQRFAGIDGTTLEVVLRQIDEDGNSLGIVGTDETVEGGTAELNAQVTGGSGGLDNPMTTADDLIKGGASGVPARLAKGSNGQVLTVSSGTVGWANSAAGFANPMTTAWDLIVGGSAGAANRLAKGADGQVLSMVSGALAWAASGAGSIPGIINLTASGDSTGATDTTNLNAAVATLNALGGIGIIVLNPALTWRFSGQVVSSFGITISAYGCFIDATPAHRTITASITTGGVMTVTVTNGVLLAGDVLIGTGLPDACAIYNQITGTTGSTGTYNVYPMPVATVGSESITATSPFIVIRSAVTAFNGPQIAWRGGQIKAHAGTPTAGVYTAGARCFLFAYPMIMVDDVHMSGFDELVYWGVNSYIITFRYCHSQFNNIGFSFRNTGSNSGEKILWVGGNISNNNYNLLNIEGEFWVVDASIDYPVIAQIQDNQTDQFGRAGALMIMRGCHLETASSITLGAPIAITASISTAGVLTVTATAGVLTIGRRISGGPDGLVLQSQLTGSTGSTGTYQLNMSLAVAVSSVSMSAYIPLVTNTGRMIFDGGSFWYDAPAGGYFVNNIYNTIVFRNQVLWRVDSNAFYAVVDANFVSQVNANVMTDSLGTCPRMHYRCSNVWNGDFETNSLVGWTSTGTVGVVSTNVNRGSYAMSVAPGGVATSRKCRIPAGVTFIELNFFAKNLHATVTGSVTITTYNDEGDTIGTQSQTIPAAMSVFTQYAIGTTGPISGGYSVIVATLTNTAGNSLYLDDFYIHLN